MDAPGTETVLVTVPGDPVPKGRPKVAVRGNFPTIYTPKKTVNYEKDVAQLARYAYKRNKPWDGPVAVSMIAFFGIPKSRTKTFKREALAGYHYCDVQSDLDNVVKSALDGMNKIVYEDDRQVVRLKGIEKRWTRTGLGRLLIKVTLLPNDYLARDL
jgi:Holliday junction resolvase RusA-like endonuclease